MKVILSMAGRGSRFTNQGFTTPKPFIEVAKQPMFFWGIKSLETINIDLLIVVALKTHDTLFNLRQLLSKFEFPYELVLLDEVTEGQLCTVLQGMEFIADNEPFLVCPSDTYIKASLSADIKQRTAIGAEGIISVFNLPGNRWSFAKVNEDGWVTAVAEKKRISNYASTGIYYFHNAGLFKMFSKELIDLDERTKGEFYVMPVYQKFIDKGFKISIMSALEMWDLGTPESKKYFENNFETISRNFKTDKH